MLKQTICGLIITAAVAAPSIDNIITQRSLIFTQTAHAADYLRHKVEWDGTYRRIEDTSFPGQNCEVPDFMLHYSRLRRDAQRNPDIFKGFPNLQEIYNIITDPSYKDEKVDGTNEEIMNVRVTPEDMIFFCATEDLYDPKYPMDKKNGVKYFGKPVRSAVTWIDITRQEESFLKKYEHPSLK